MPISAEQRVRNAKTKARIIWQRETRLFFSGKAEMIPCLLDLERQFITDEIRRATT